MKSITLKNITHTENIRFYMMSLTSTGKMIDRIPSGCGRQRLQYYRLAGASRAGEVRSMMKMEVSSKQQQSGESSATQSGTSFQNYGLSI